MGGLYLNYYRNQAKLRIGKKSREIFNLGTILVSCTQDWLYQILQAVTFSEPWTSPCSMARYSLQRDKEMLDGTARHLLF